MNKNIIVKVNGKKEIYINKAMATREEAFADAEFLSAIKQIEEENNMKFQNVKIHEVPNEDWHEVYVYVEGEIKGLTEDKAEKILKILNGNWELKLNTIQTLHNSKGGAWKCA